MATNRQKPVKFDKYCSNYILYYTTNPQTGKLYLKLLAKQIGSRVDFAIFLDKMDLIYNQ
jgi:hypothetical protein